MCQKCTFLKSTIVPLEKTHEKSIYSTTIGKKKFHPCAALDFMIYRHQNAVHRDILWQNYSLICLPPTDPQHFPQKTPKKPPYGDGFWAKSPKKSQNSRLTRKNGFFENPKKPKKRSPLGDRVPKRGSLEPQNGLKSPKTQSLDRVENFDPKGSKNLKNARFVHGTTPLRRRPLELNLNCHDARPF